MKKYALPFLMLVILFTVFCLFGGLKQRSTLAGADSKQSLAISEEGLDGMIRWEAPADPTRFCFVVERSLNGKEYTALGHLQAGSSDVEAYAFRDVTYQQLDRHVIHYRIREIMKSGVSAIFDQKRMKRDLATQVAILEAEPGSADQVTVRYIPGNQTTAHMNIVDEKGRIILYKQLPTAHTEQELHIDVNEWENGTYVIQLFNGSNLTEKSITIG